MDKMIMRSQPFITPNYCSYCGYSFRNVVCIICGETELVCGCNPRQVVCDKCLCVQCGDPALDSEDLDENGYCKACVKSWNSDDG